MEKSTSSSVDTNHDYSSSEMFSVVIGFSLFWACLFSMLVRNTILDVETEQLWYHLVMRIVFCLGFGTVAFIVSRNESGKPGKLIARCMLIPSLLFLFLTLGSSLIHVVAKVPHTFIFDLVVWTLSGMILSYVLFYWIPVVSDMDELNVANCIAFSVACGSVISFVINLLPPLFNTIFFSICPLLSFLICQLIARRGKKRVKLIESLAIPYAISRKNAGLSWSFGIIYIMYGIVSGLGVGLITQHATNTPLFIGTTLSILIGVAAAAIFMRKFAGTISQMDVLRMLFPFLIAPLLLMSLFTGLIFTVSNFLLLADYVFLVAISLAFEVQIANSQHASPLFVVGMSQGALNGGIAIGFAFSLLPSATNVIGPSTLAIVALGLVMLLAVVIIFAPSRQIVADAQRMPARREQSHWKVRCATVARNAGLSPRETEVFFLLAKGRNIEHIQNKLCISVHTVKTHVYNIYQKMDISSREELLDAVDAVKIDSDTASDTDNNAPL